MSESEEFQVSLAADPLDWVRDSPHLAGEFVQYGLQRHVLESLHEKSADIRWRSELIVVQRAGRVVACAPIHEPRHAHVPDLNLTAEIDRLGVSHGSLPGTPSALFLGGLAGLRGGVLLTKRRPAIQVGALTALLRWASQRATDRGASLAAMYIPDEQAKLMQKALAGKLVLMPGPANAVLILTGDHDLHSFIERLPKAARHTWRRDEQDRQRRGTYSSLEPLDDALVEEASPLASQIKNRHGVREHPRVTAMRMRHWIRGEYARTAYCWTVRDGLGKLRGFSIGVNLQSSLQMIELGLPDQDPDRQRLYFELQFRAPTVVAIAHGLGTVDFGPGNPVPKTNRGAVLVPQWHIYK